MSFPRSITSDLAEDLQIEVESLQFQVADLIAETMAEQGVTKAELARRLGVSPAHVTQMLSGERNLTLKSLAEALYALDRRVEAQALPLREEAEPHATAEAHPATHGWSETYFVDSLLHKQMAMAADRRGRYAHAHRPDELAGCHGDGLRVLEPRG